MQFKKVVPYKIRRLIPMLGMAGATLFMGGCEKEEPIVPTRDVEIELDQGVPEKVIALDENGDRCPSDLAKYYVEDPNIRRIYLVPVGSWTNCRDREITSLRHATLELLLNYSSKFRGKGDFNFRIGEASKVPEDSLWYVANGWTINKKYLEQNQR